MRERRVGLDGQAMRTGRGGGRHSGLDQGRRRGLHRAAASLQNSRPAAGTADRVEPALETSPGMPRATRKWLALEEPAGTTAVRSCAASGRQTHQRTPARAGAETQPFRRRATTPERAGRHEGFEPIEVRRQDGPGACRSAGRPSKAMPRALGEQEPVPSTRSARGDLLANNLSAGPSRTLARQAVGLGQLAVVMTRGDSVPPATARNPARRPVDLVGQDVAAVALSQRGERAEIAGAVSTPVGLWGW